MNLATRVLFILSVFTTLAPTAAHAATAADEGDDEIGAAKAGPFRFGLITQARYTQTFTQSTDGSGVAEDTTAKAGDGYHMRRARLEIKVKATKKIRGEIYADFVDVNSKNASALKDAFIELRPHPRAIITVGRFKIPFSMMHLRSISKLEVAENGITDDLLVDEHFAGFDLGAMTSIEPLRKRRWLAINAGLFRGDEKGKQATPAGMIAGRVTTAFWKPLQIGAGVAWRPKAAGNPMFPDVKHFGADRYAGLALGFDLRFTLDALHMQAEIIHASRTEWWRQGARHLLGGSFMASYDIPVNADVRLQPAIKAELLDTDLEETVGMQQMYTIACSAYFTPMLRVLVEADQTFVQPMSVNFTQSLAVMPQFLTNNTQVLVQLQLAL